MTDTKFWPEGGDELYAVFEDSTDLHVIMPPERSLQGCRNLAEATAACGHRALYRVFRVTNLGPPVRHEFVIAYSVLDGTITELGIPTIPRVHADRTKAEKEARVSRELEDSAWHEERRREAGMVYGNRGLADFGGLELDHQGCLGHACHGCYECGEE